MNINIAVCDDDKNILSTISEELSILFSKNNISVKIDIFFDSTNILSRIKNKYYYDVYFLDLDMPILNGFDLSEEIRMVDNDSIIIYITNRNDLMQNAFKYKALGFVRKNNLKEELASAVDVVNNELKRKNNKIEIKNKKGLKDKIYILNISDIIYIDYIKHKIIMHIYNFKNISFYETLNFFVNDAKFEEFILINQGCLVNPIYIKSIEQDTIILNDNTNLYVSRRKLNHVIEKFTEYGRRNIL